MTTDPERTLALTYAPAGAQRSALTALLALDEALGDVVRTTTQPAIGQIRLAWWDNALRALDTAPPPAMPVLEALARDVLPLGPTGAVLADMIEGWDVLIEEPSLDDPALVAFAQRRGGRLFAIAAQLLGGDRERATCLGQGWALADLARYLEDAEAARRATDAARRMSDESVAGVPRSLGVLTLTARLDLAGAPHGGPKRAARLAWFGLTGR